MAWNEKLVIFPALPKHLITLNARRCSKLRVIPLMHGMKSLKTMDLSHCKRLTQLPPLSLWQSLRCLNLDGCKQLVELDTLPKRFASIKLSFSLKQTIRQVEKSGPMQNVSDKTQRLCMIGCDNIRLNIYRLLQGLQCLEQLDLSVSPAEDNLPVETQPLVGQKYCRVIRDASSVAVLFCFVFDSNENVRLPEMEVVMTLNGDDRERSFSRTFGLPSIKKDGSGKYILRVCVLNGWYQKKQILGTFFEEGEMRCSYSVRDRLSQRGSPVLLKQVEMFLLSEHATTKVTKYLRQWRLLSNSHECEGSGYSPDEISDEYSR